MRYFIHLFAMPLSKDILATVAYYDVFGFPLTAFEVWQHLLIMDSGTKPGATSLRVILSALEEEALSKKISRANGFYMLKGREGLVASRLRKEKISSEKLKRVRKLVKFLGFIPFVRMIGVTGSLAMKQSEEGSDWDFFVILKEGHIWTGRTLLTGFLHIIRKRRHGAFSRDRACLNYYITDARLEIFPQDFFAANEYRFIIPMLGSEAFRKFELKNRWIRDIHPNMRLSELLPLWYVPDRRLFLAIRGLLEKIFDNKRLESFLGRIQKKKIERNPKSLWEGAHISATDSALIFLPRPRGPKHFERFMAVFGETRVKR